MMIKVLKANNFCHETPKSPSLLRFAMAGKQGT
jgi:hypothetical protein